MRRIVALSLGLILEQSRRDKRMKKEYRRIVAVGKDDAYHEDTPDLRGKLLEIDYINNLSPGGFYSCHGFLVNKAPFRISEKYFYSIKLSKQRYNKKGEKI